MINMLCSEGLPQSIYQSIKIYIVPLQDPYSEALPTHAKGKRIEHRHSLGGALDQLKVHFRTNHRKRTGLYFASLMLHQK